tara:strand:+ start:3275 stop:3400 length:126 start_codon:yes stop_codon:yes gene_type:complete
MLKMKHNPTERPMIEGAGRATCTTALRASSVSNPAAATELA